MPVHGGGEGAQPCERLTGDGRNAAGKDRLARQCDDVLADAVGDRRSCTICRALRPSPVSRSQLRASPPP